MNSKFPNVTLKKKWASNLKELATDIISIRVDDKGTTLKLLSKRTLKLTA